MNSSRLAEGGKSFRSKKNIVRVLACAAALLAGGAAHADSIVTVTDPSAFTNYASFFEPDGFTIDDGFYFPSQDTVFAYNLGTDQFTYSVSLNSPGNYWGATNTSEAGYAAPFDYIFQNEFGAYTPQNSPGVTFTFASYFTGLPLQVGGFGIDL